jgi:tricorn protease
MIDATKFIEGWDVGPDANRLLFIARGDLFTVPAESGITRNLSQTSNAHERDAAWSADGKWICYTSDASGEDEIYIRPQNGIGDPTRITTNGDVYKYHLMWSPDSKKILWSDRKQHLQYVDIDTKVITSIESSDIGEYNFYDWSPDSKWICFVRPERLTNNRIFLYNLASKSLTPVTDNWYNSYEPTFTSDGKYLMFISDRDFNPSFSNIEFQIAYQNMSKIYLVTLAKDTPSPFAPENNEVKADEKPKEEAAPASKKNDKSKAGTEEKKSTPDVKIDLDGISNRVLVLPVEAAQYFNLQSAENTIYYQRQKASENTATLLVYKFKEKKEESLGEFEQYRISANKKKMVVVKNLTYSIIDLPMSKIQTDKSVSLSGMKVMVDHKQEYQEIFNESWRQMRDFFYAPNMHGLDWNAMKTKYGSLVPYVNHRADLTYIVGEMIGELSIGHAYTGGGDKPKPERIPMGLLGAKISRDVSGFYKINKSCKEQTGALIFVRH